jgi:undecaprenyl-diphosphatase
MELWQAIVLAIVEGLTEYLPVSSTGHLILVSALMGIHQDPFTKDFVIMVQFGAIFAVAVEYFRFFLRSRKIYPILFVGFLPAAVIGLLVKKKIDILLESVWTVAFALLIGGVLLLFTDKIFRKEEIKIKEVNDVSFMSALKIGCFQCLAFIPGVSRAAATIWGGLSLKLDQRTATEFSFLLALPTLAGATFLKAVKVIPTITSDQWMLLLIGNLISFAVGYLAIRLFLRFVTRFGLKGFGYYRIVLGLVVIAALLLKVDLGNL